MITTFQDWESRSLNEEQIFVELSMQLSDEVAVKAKLEEYRKYKAENRQKNGFIATGVGAVICFIATVIALINPSPTLTNFFLYWGTGIGAAISFVGLYLIFEKE